MSNPFGFYDSYQKFSELSGLKQRSKKEQEQAVDQLDKLYQQLGPVKFHKSLVEWVNSQEFDSKATSLVSSFRYYVKDLLTSEFKTKNAISNHFQNREQTIASPEIKEHKLKLYDYVKHEEYEIFENSYVYDEEFNENVIQQLKFLMREETAKYIVPYITTDVKFPLLVTCKQSPLKTFQLLLDIRNYIYKLSDKLIISPYDKNFLLCHTGLWEDFMMWGNGSGVEYQDERQILYNEMFGYGKLRRLGLVYISDLDNIEEYCKEYKRLLRYLILNNKCIIGVDYDVQVSNKNWLASLLKNRCVTLDITNDLNNPMKKFD